jgi:hypothetical protein
MKPCNFNYNLKCKLSEFSIVNDSAHDPYSGLNLGQDTQAIFRVFPQSLQANAIQLAPRIGRRLVRLLYNTSCCSMLGASLNKRQINGTHSANIFMYHSVDSSPHLTGYRSSSSSLLPHESLFFHICVTDSAELRPS